MARKFGGELNLKFGGLVVGKIKFHQKISNQCPSVQTQDVNQSTSQGERKLVSSGLDYGVTHPAVPTKVPSLTERELQ